MPAWPPPIDDTLLSLDASGRPTLYGAWSREDGRLVFPSPADAERFDPVALPSEGRLWSWTIQRFRPKSPPYAGSENFVPYPVGYVELEGAIIVEARLSGAPAGGWRIGMPMKLVAEAFPMADGSVRSTYAFAAVEVAA